MVLALEGDLGAGKTTMTKGIAKALNITEIINSPTFTQLQLHQQQPQHQVNKEAEYEYRKED